MAVPIPSILFCVRIYICVLLMLVPAAVRLCVAPLEERHTG